MDLFSFPAFCLNIRLCQIQMHRHGLRKVLTDCLQSQAFQCAPCLLWYLSACWRAAIKASPGISQVENAKFSLSGKKKYFLCVYCSLWEGVWLHFASFCFAVSAWQVKVMLCSFSTCLIWLCSTDRMKSWFACQPASSCYLSLHRSLPVSLQKRFWQICCSYIKSS